MLPVRLRTSELLAKSFGDPARGIRNGSPCIDTCEDE